MKLVVALVMAVALSHTQAVPTITVSLESAFREKGTVDIMIVMKEPTSRVVSSINSRAFKNSNDKTTTMVQELRQFTTQSQKGVMDILNRKRSTGFKQFWITNRISVTGATWDIVEALKECSDIEEIREAIVVHLEESSVVTDSNPQALEWGVQKIDSTVAWAAGFEGEGIVVSTIDTGVLRTHECLVANERSEYSWFDPYDATLTASDSNGHGTHTMGTIVGTGGTGVAPKSKWIACRGCGSADCSEEALLRCGQWTVCPTLPDGTGEDCSKKPHLSSNSWGGGQEDPWFDDTINAWHAASIVPVFAIGNSGPGCRTANSPGDSIRPVLSVGATNADDEVAFFSSHGPTALTTRIKPEVTAPGLNIRSASNAGDRLYVFNSGTSMACPHVAGAVAVLLSKKPTATFDEIAFALKHGAHHPIFWTIVCTGGVNTTYPWPNNSYGNGRINVNHGLRLL